jgi:hypothetical protein
MKGRIESGQLCIVIPVDPPTLSVGDIVLCKVGGSEYLHVVKGDPKRAIPNRKQPRIYQRVDGTRGDPWQVRSR